MRFKVWNHRNSGDTLQHRDALVALFGGVQTIGVGWHLRLVVEIKADSVGRLQKFCRERRLAHVEDFQFDQEQS